ncbi:MAG TPA: plastocyanin/azurin family copper-binding protein [Candidatus Paceibacterota bacterium]|nr:plastocyanin/azurin family copper-binding protein [Candidatus Paceibacterota bacterium]
MRIFWTIVVIIVIIVGIILINRNSKNDNLDVGNDTNVESTSTGGNISTNESVATTTDGSLSPQSIFTVNGGSFYFKPNTIKVKVGDTVTINFVNDGGTHDFRIDEFGVATKTLEVAGAQDKVTFVANKKGSFEYYCSVGTHRQMGMKGTLVVE